LSMAFSITHNVLQSSASGGNAANTEVDFLTAISHQDYRQAYSDLSASLTLVMSLTGFTEQAQNADRCSGLLTNFTKVANSAAIQGSQRSVAYTLTRSKLTQPYTLKLMLNQDPGSEKWLIMSYGEKNDLGPGLPLCG